MAPSSLQVPQDLRRVLRHADRLARLLFGLEREDLAVPWMVGRSGELRAVVSSTVADWRAGRCDDAAALDAIRSYLDTLHRGAAKHLRSSGVALDCCGVDDAITRTPDADTAASLVSTLNAWHNELRTCPATWTDGPEVLARIRDELPQVEGHAQVLSRRLGTRSVTKDDLRGFGREGLLDAARSFDEHRGIPFAQWASLRIRSAMMDGVRRWGGLPRRLVRERSALESTSGLRSPHDHAAALSAAWAPKGEREARSSDRGATPSVSAHAGEPDPVADLDASPEERLARAEIRALVREAVGHLATKERQAVEGYYYAGCDLKQIAAAAGVTESGAHRMLTRALEKLDAALRRRDVGSAVNRHRKGRL